MFQRALNACDFDENNPKYPLYQYRAATIYYRLGSLYHRHIWTVANCNEAKRKNIIQLSKLNYEKAAKMFFLSMDCINYLTAQMQRFALTEYIAGSKFFQIFQICFCIYYFFLFQLQLMLK